jgi:hypothetical protein
MANQPGGSQPNFDFQNFAKQLENSITKALKDAFKKTDASELSSRIKSSFNDVDLDQMLNTQTSITSIRKLKDSIKQVQEIQKVGGIDAYNQIQEEGKLREFWLKSNGNLSDEEIQRRLKNYRKQQESLKLEKEQLETLEQIRNVQKDYEKVTSKLSSKTKDLMINIKGALSSPKAMAGAATVALEKIGQSFSQAFKQMKSEGLSTTQAISEYFNSLKDGALLFSKEVREAQKGFRETGGTLSEAREFGKEAAQAAAKYGGSMEQAGKALGTFQKLPGMSKEAAIAANDFSGALAQAADVPADVVMKEVANNADAVATAGAKNVVSLQKAIVNSAKLGVEFSKIEGIANKLLDFESSINAQMEASVLLGREINLDKAREAALRGDYLAVQQEVLKAVGSEAQFNQMNTLQKQKLAEAMGMQVGDLAKIVSGQGQDTELAKAAAEAKKEEAGYMDMIKSFAAENAGALVSSIPSLIMQTGQLLIQYKTMQSMRKLAGEDGAGGKKGGILSKVKNFFGFGDKTKTETPAADPAAGAADKTKKLSEASERGPKPKAGKDVKDFLKNLADGLKAMGDGKVLFGAVNLIPAAAGLVAMIPGAVGAYALQKLDGKALKKSMEGLAGGLTAMASGKALMGALVLGLSTAAFVVGVAGLPFLLAIAIGGQLMGVGLKGLASGLGAMANPKVLLGGLVLSALLLSLGAAIFLAATGIALLVTAMAQVPIEQLLLMPVALMGIGFAMVYLSTIGMVAAIGIMAAAGALIAMSIPLMIIGVVAQTGALNILGEGLKTLSDSSGGLMQVASALTGIGIGLGAMAFAGIAALPIIGALAGLATVAPALSGLADLFGGGGGGGEEDKMDVVVQKLDQLISVVSTPAAVTMDGRKVGDAIRLNINGTAIR